MTSKCAKCVIGFPFIFYIINDVLCVALMWWWSVSFDDCLGIVTMKAILVFTMVYVLSCEGTQIIESTSTFTYTKVNQRPIIGILSQEQAYHMKDTYAKENFTSYIAASYVKSVEASGARVVPIMIGKNRDYYKEIMGKINGIVFPGGVTYFNQSMGYADAGQHIYEIAQEMTDAGNYFPLFGTCLGFELFIILASGRGNPENRGSCRSFGNIPLIFNNGYKTSKMFKNIPNEIARVLETRDVTVNAHSLCILDENMQKYNLSNDWRILSYANDDNGKKFVSSIEHKRYPFYGIQFHPEKTSFEWSRKYTFTHSLAAIQANRYFMDFFVSECRKNHNSFSNEAEENSYLIYNYKPYFTGMDGKYYTQCYFFEPKGEVPNDIHKV